MMQTIIFIICGLGLCAVLLLAVFISSNELNEYENELKQWKKEIEERKKL